MTILQFIATSSHGEPIFRLIYLKCRGEDPQFYSWVGLTKTGYFMGTIQYTAPEIFIDGFKMADSRTDIYALGHILYELSIGRIFGQFKDVVS